MFLPCPQLQKFGNTFLVLTEQGGVEYNEPLLERSNLNTPDDHLSKNGEINVQTIGF